MSRWPLPLLANLKLGNSLTLTGASCCAGVRSELSVGCRGGDVPLPPINGQSQQNSQSGPVKQPQATTPHEQRARTDEMGLANLALRMKYRGLERTKELPLTQDMIGQLAFEAQFRNMSIGGLVGELLKAIIKRDLFQHVLLDPNSKQP